MEERRKLQRFSLRIPGKVVGNGKPYRGQQVETRDISSNGAFLLTDTPLEAGAKLRLALELPVGDFQPLFQGQRSISLRIRGLVIRQEATGVAVQFRKRYRFDFSG